MTDCLTVAAYHSHQGFSEVRVVQYLDFCVVFCRYLFILSVIELSSLLRFTASAYAFGIFKLFLTSRDSIVVIFTIRTHWKYKEIIQEKRWHLDGSMNRCFGYCLFVASQC